MVNREEIRWAYRSLLGREPEGEDAYRQHAIHADFTCLRRALTASVEGTAALRPMLNGAAATPPFSFRKTATVFIHIPKTGGTALHQWLCKATGSPLGPHAYVNNLPSYTVNELNQLDFVSGHLTFDEALAVPRETKRLVCCFREPFARLVSLYRFFRAHPSDRTAGAGPLIHLAKALSIEEFFSHESIVANHHCDNTYLRIFGDAALMGDRQGADRLAASKLAISRMSELSAIAIAEYMDLSASLIASRLGYGHLAPPTRLNVTDQLHKHGVFGPADAVLMTSRLKTIMEPLVEYDLPIYDHARMTFQEHLRAKRQAAA